MSRRVAFRVYVALLSPEAWGLYVSRQSWPWTSGTELRVLQTVRAHRWEVFGEIGCRDLDCQGGRQPLGCLLLFCSSI
jgi:hypothetical protein